MTAPTRRTRRPRNADSQIVAVIPMRPGPVWPDSQGRYRLSTDEHIAALLKTAPPLTDEQRDRLAVLLRPTPDAA